MCDWSRMESVAPTQLYSGNHRLWGNRWGLNRIGRWIDWGCITIPWSWAMIFADPLFFCSASWRSPSPSWWICCSCLPMTVVGLVEQCSSEVCVCWVHCGLTVRIRFQTQTQTQRWFEQKKSLLQKQQAKNGQKKVKQTRVRHLLGWSDKGQTKPRA